MHMHLNLCESYTCLQQVRLEETVWDSSKHYSLYTIKNDKTVVAVLMDVKLTSHKKFQHALGHNSVLLSSLLPSPLQLLGYYVKFGTDGENPPLCALLSEKGMQVVCFPYCLETTVQPVPVVDCLVLPELPLFTATCIPTVNQSLLVLILLLTDEDVHFYKNMNLLLLKDATRKSLETHIQSLNEKMADELCEMKRKREDVERQIEDEERKREDVEHKREDAERKREDAERKREDAERKREYVERQIEDEERKRKRLEERKRKRLKERKREDVEKMRSAR